MVQLEWHLWAVGKQDRDDVSSRRWRGRCSSAELCLEHRTHQEVFVFPGLPARQAALGKTNGQIYCLGLISVCVLRSRFLT